MARSEGGFSTRYATIAVILAILLVALAAVGWFYYGGEDVEPGEGAAVRVPVGEDFEDLPD